MVWIANRWRINTINIGWQESLFTGAANNPPRLRCGSRIAYQHLDPIKHKRLRPEEGCASGIKNVRGHVIAVRPDTQLRIIEKIGSEIKAIAVPGSSRVPGLRHGDALRHWNASTGELATSELAAFITDQALITVRKDDGLDIGAVVERWDASPDLAKFGVGYLLHGLLDYIVDGHFEAVQSLDDSVEALEDDLFAPNPMGIQVQRRSFELRKSLVLLRRIVIPMREVVNALMRRDLHVVGDDLVPYYQDVYDHVLRAAEWNDSLRDLVTSILETNVTIQGNRLNIITKKVTGWAAIIAVPTLITGYFGMNVPYPGFSERPVSPPPSPP